MKYFCWYFWCCQHYPYLCIAFWFTLWFSAPRGSP